MASIERSIGDINERGYLRGMRRRGYTPQKCILELIANCIDALEKQFAPRIAKKIIAKIERKIIKLMDNGIGMDEDGAAAMFSMHRENHSGDQSKGVSGIGAKPATLILSEDTLVKILTRKLGGAFLAIIVPWNKIIEEGVYTGKVIVREMSEEEKVDFIKDRKENGMLASEEAVGTTIEFLHSDGLQDLFYQNFLPVDNSSVKDPLDRILTVFGRSSDVEFEYHEMETHKVLPKYDYFGEHNPDYYRGIRHDQIEHWWSPREKKDRYLWMRPDGRYEITQSGRGFDKAPVQMKTNTHGYTKAGEFRVKTGCRVDSSIFNHDAPTPLRGNNYHPYDIFHLGEDASEEFVGSTALVRNNQLIGTIPPADIKVSSARASPEGWFDMMLVKQDLEYNPVSDQDNRQDIAMGIQENKNQFDGKAIPLTLTRILRAIKVVKAKEIRDYFAARLEEVRPVPVPPPAPPAPAEDESEDEEEDEVESQTATESDAESVSGSESSDSAPSSESSEEEDSPTPTPTPTPTPEPPAPEPEAPAPAPSVSGADLLALLSRLQIDATQNYQGEWLMLEAILKGLV
jgi:hypothetical protein